ncbi:hypothetical protein LP420_16960 [Massilia sp. B-10]|nr:hypothetical protein LP420_16960 [Massilia sp. B-10]
MCESLNVRMRDGELLRLQILPPAVLGAGRAVRLPHHHRHVPDLDHGAGLPGGAHDHAPAQAAGAGGQGPGQRHQPSAAGPGRQASEIRQASAAFNAMQARIRQYIFQRTQMLAAITHDLQTPLTRMRLRLEKVADPELQQRLVGDLSAMQAMVREGLELARSMDTTETMAALDLDSLLGSVCCDATDA